MGAGASVSPREWADPELKGLIDTVASLSNDVNIHHRNLLEKELSKSFKQHEKIIKIITSKTKRKLDHMMSTTAFSLQDLYTLVGNKDYGNFMTRLCTPGPVLMKLDLENAVRTRSGAICGPWARRANDRGCGPTQPRPRKT